MHARHEAAVSADSVHFGQSDGAPQIEIVLAIHDGGVDDTGPLSGGDEVGRDDGPRRAGAAGVNRAGK